MYCCSCIAMSERRRRQAPTLHLMANAFVARARAHALRAIAARARLLALEATIVSRQECLPQASCAHLRPTHGSASSRLFRRLDAQLRHRRFIDDLRAKPTASRVRRKNKDDAVCQRSARTRVSAPKAPRGRNLSAPRSSIAPRVAASQYTSQSTPAADVEREFSSHRYVHTRSAAHACCRVIAAARRRVERRGAMGGPSTSVNGTGPQNAAVQRQNVNTAQNELLQEVEKVSGRRGCGQGVTGHVFDSNVGCTCNERVISGNRVPNWCGVTASEARTPGYTDQANYGRLSVLDQYQRCDPKRVAAARQGSGE